MRNKKNKNDQEEKLVLQIFSGVLKKNQNEKYPNL